MKNVSILSIICCLHEGILVGTHTGQLFRYTRDTCLHVTITSVDRTHSCTELHSCLEFGMPWIRILGRRPGIETVTAFWCLAHTSWDSALKPNKAKLLTQNTLLHLNYNLKLFIKQVCSHRNRILVTRDQMYRMPATATGVHGALRLSRVYVELWAGWGGLNVQT
jgi:hypothetical protein